tara:strand:- start:403 stop:1563 length:1161 start_codon:yes stop_codon:yes gene_type:complete
MTTYAETETPASRVLYINSDNATTKFNNKDTDFEFVLEEPIIVPSHHAILASVYSAEIPFSFYNFELGRNTLLDYQITGFGNPANYVNVGGKDTFDFTPSGGCYRFLVPEGNYTTYQLADTLSAGILTSPGGVPALDVKYNPIKQKFEFVCIVPGIRCTFGLKHGLFSGLDGDDINEEIGFDLNNIQGDPFFELDIGSPPFPWNNGYTNPPLVVPGAGTDINNGPYPIQTYLLADDVADMNSAIRSLFIRTNLSSQSVLDSFIGGGFSNIFCRVPLNADPGETLRIEPRNGDIHKLLLKTKTITSVSITLTNQRNRIIDLNGLNFDVSIKLDFVEVKDLPEPLNVREQIDKRIAEKDLEEIKEEREKTRKKIDEKLKEKKKTKKKK